MITANFINIVFEVGLGAAVIYGLLKFQSLFNSPGLAVKLSISLTKINMTATTINLPSATATLTATDANGLATTTFPGPIVWTVSDSTLFTLAPSADLLSCVVTPTGTSGTATVQVASDALTASVEVTFVAAAPAPAPTPAPAPAPAPGVATAMTLTLVQN